MPASRTDELIASKGFTFNVRPYQPGDRFDASRLTPTHRRFVDRMIHGPNRQIVELSPATMADALERRPRDAGPPAGFTVAGLLGLRLITEEQAVRFGWLEGESEADPTAAGDADFVPPEGSIAVQDLWVVLARTNGGPKRYDVVDANGARVKQGGTIVGDRNAVAWANEFISKRPPAPPVTPPEPAADTAPSGSDPEAEQKLLEISVAPVETMPLDDLKALLRALDKHGLDDVPEDVLRAEAIRLRDTALAQLRTAAGDADSGEEIDLEDLRALLADDTGLDLRYLNQDELRAIAEAASSKETRDGGDVQHQPGPPA